MGHPPWIQEMWVQILARLPSQLELELRRPAPTWAPAVTSYATGPASSFLLERFSIVQNHGKPTARGEGGLCEPGAVRDPGSPSCSRDCQGYAHPRPIPMGKKVACLVENLELWVLGMYIPGSAPERCFSVVGLSAFTTVLLEIHIPSLKRTQEFRLFQTLCFCSIFFFLERKLSLHSFVGTTQLGWPCFFWVSGRTLHTCIRTESFKVIGEAVGCFVPCISLCFSSHFSLFHCLFT